MVGLSSPQVSGAWRLRFAWSTCSALVLCISLVLVSPFSHTLHLLASFVGLLFGGLALAAACAFQASRPRGSRQMRAWLLFGSAAAVGTIGNLALFGAGTSDSAGVGSLVSEVCLLLALVLGVSGTIAFPSTPRRPAEVVRIVLDGVVIGGSLLFFASLVLSKQIVGTDADLANRALPLLVPVIDVVVATTAFLLYVRRDPGDGGLLGLISVGCALFAVSDFGAAMVSVGHPFRFGNPIDLGWIAGYCLIALAVLGAYAGPRSPGARTRGGSVVIGTALMFTLFLAAAVSNLTGAQSGRMNTVSAVLWLLVLLAVIGRQVSLTFDNEQMRQVLEQRVIDRSRDLRTVTQQSALMLNSVGDGIYGVDRLGVVTFVNPVAARVLGYTPDELIGVNAHSAFHAPPADGVPYPEDGCYITQAITGGVVTNAREDIYTRADGGTVPVEVTASPATDDGEAVGAVVVFRDITQRLEVDRLKDEFVSIVSHELKTPLTSIRGALAMLAAGSLGELSPAASRMTTVALDSSVRLGRLITDILEVERIHSGVLPMTASTVDAHSLVESAVSQVSLVAQTARVRLEVGQVEGLVVADGDRAQQTLINLLDNAVKFSPPESVVRVSTCSRGTFVEFVISDSGRGIPPDKLESIFQRFHQVDSSDARERGGTGLGLAISRSIIDRLGGRIWAENNPDRGATLRFTLPRAPEAQPGEQTISTADRVGVA